MKNLVLISLCSTAALLCLGPLAGTGAAQFAAPVLPPDEKPRQPEAPTKPFFLQPAKSATLLVTTTADGGPGSLRDAIDSAAPGDTISFSLPLPAVLSLTNRLLIDKDLTVLGPGPDQLTVMRSDVPSTPAYRVFFVRSGTVVLSGLTIRNGMVAPPASGDLLGGGIFNTGSLTIMNCVITRNVAPSGVVTPSSGRGFGGGIFSAGPLTLLNSTVAGNYATFAGGGTYVFFVTNFLAEGCTVSGNQAGVPGSPATDEGQGGGINVHGTVGALMRNCTVSGNTALGLGGGGGVLNLSFGSESSFLTIEACTITRNFGQFAGGVASVSFTGGQPVVTTLKNSIVAGNTTDFTALAPAVFQTLGHNLDGDGTSGFVNGVNGDIVGAVGGPVDARLGPLQNNGGMTLTHAMLAGSPAADAGDCIDSNGNPLSIDQRGVARPQGGGCDIGALENQRPTIVRCPPAQTVQCGTSATLTASLLDPDGDALIVVWSVDGVAYRTNQTAGTHPPAPVNASFTATYGLGAHIVALSVSDGKAAPVVCTTTITARDTIPPVITAISATPNVLWPPNHRMVPVTISAQVTDACGPVILRIIAVQSNEPDNGTGDGNTTTDWVITGNLTLLLRAERAGNGHGRVYTITVQARDASGNVSVRTVTVSVPHNQ